MHCEQRRLCRTAGRARGRAAPDVLLEDLQAVDLLQRLERLLALKLGRHLAPRARHLRAPGRAGPPFTRAPGAAPGLPCDNAPCAARALRRLQ
jgi:hypothetical protein